MVFLKETIRFSKNSAFPQATPKFSQNDPKMEPTWPPGRLRRAQNATSNSCLFLASNLRFISSIFGAILASKIDPKIDQKSTSAAKALQDASGQPSWSHFGTILPSFWDPRTFIFEHSSFHICCLFPLSAPACCLRGGRFRGRSPLLDPATEHSLKL